MFILHLPDLGFDVFHVFFCWFVVLGSRSGSLVRRLVRFVVDVVCVVWPIADRPSASDGTSETNKHNFNILR